MENKLLFYELNLFCDIYDKFLCEFALKISVAYSNYSIFFFIFINSILYAIFILVFYIIILGNNYLFLHMLGICIGRYRHRYTN